MDSLLRWSIENSTPRSPDAHPPTRKDIDPEIIDHILGKPDPVLMKEALEIALDQKRDEGARIQALDGFEMLVEQIDNANSTHMSCTVASLGSGAHMHVLRPRQPEDVGSLAVSFDVSGLFRRNQDADSLDYWHRGPEQSFRPKLGTCSS